MRMSSNKNRSHERSNSGEKFELPLSVQTSHNTDDGLSRNPRPAEKDTRIPRQITALHQIFASNLKRTIRDDSALSERRSWFKNFSSQSGENLNEKQVNKLTNITKNWALSEERVEALLLCSVLWSSCPQLFWDGDIRERNIFRRCFVDLERIREIDPLRRKVLLIILSQHVQEEQRQWRINGKRQRSRSKNLNANLPEANRNRMFLLSSLRIIAQRFWPDADVAKQRKTKKALSLYSRFGWRWQHIEPQGIILSLPDSAAKRY
ncbi:hypothetical protein N7453_009666 [Penicillium expansum]|nr:hypothetical protein N7453_009666 [Penicillium expansum]